MWLGEQIPERGIGNGASLLIFFSIVERIWPETLRTIEALRAGSLTVPVLLIVLGIMVLVVAGAGGGAGGGRRIPRPISPQVVGRGGGPAGGEKVIPPPLHHPGVIAIIFPPSLII